MKVFEGVEELESREDLDVILLGRSQTSSQPELTISVKLGLKQMVGFLAEEGGQVGTPNERPEALFRAKC